VGRGLYHRSWQRPKVNSLVYVAAYVPDKGQSLEDISEKYPQPEILKTFEGRCRLSSDQ
jgi:hypothetical protein